MHLRVTYPVVFVLSLLSLALAAPDVGSKPKPKPSPTPTPTPKPPACTKELLCCLEATTSSSPDAKALIGLLGISLTAEQKQEEVGLTCSSLQKRGIGDACLFKTLCCDKSFEAGFIAIGCSSVST